MPGFSQGSPKDLNKTTLALQAAALQRARGCRALLHKAGVPSGAQACWDGVLQLSK